MKKALAFLLGVSLILLLGGLVKATEYDPSNPWYLSGLFSAPRASSIACSPSLSHCLTIIYDAVGTKLRGFLVADPRTNWGTFMPFANFEKSVNYAGYSSTFVPFGNYPFGVQYNKNNGNYYFWYYDDTLSHPIQPYVYYPINNTIKLLTQLPLPLLTCPIVFGQGTANTGNLYYDGYGSVWKYNMFTGTNVNTGTSTPYGSFFCNSIDLLRTYVGEKPNGIAQIYLAIQYQYAGTKNTTFSANMTGFPAGFAGIHYELNNDIYYAINATANVTWGIYKVTSPDFFTYSGNALYYAFNPAIDEYIPHSIGAKADAGAMYQQYRECNSTYGGYGCPQIDVSNVSFTPIYFQSVVINPITLANTPVQTFVQASCNALNYTTSGTTSGVGTLTLGLPCTTNITITFINTNLRPDIYTETISLPVGCSQFFIKATYSEPYTLQVKVTDGLTGQPVQGALVTLDSSTNTTSSDGKAQIANVFPFDSPTFVSQSFYGSPLCSQALQTIGTVHPFYYSVGKSQYSTVTTSPLYLVNGTNQQAIGSLTSVIYPNAINVQLTTHTMDGFTVNPITIISNWSGAFNQSNILQGGSYNPNQTTAGGMPVNIILYSNLSTYNLTVYVTFNNVTYMKVTSITNGTNSDCLGGYCTIDFTLPYTFTNFPCFINNDCVGGTCLGNIFYDLNGCKAGICSYNQQFCTSCDSRVGCYNIGTTEPCSGDLDCNKTCTSPSTARYGYCASTGNCVYKNVPCDSNVACINTTIPIIAANGSTIGSYAAGICANHQVCFSQSTTQQLFQIIKQWVSIGFILNPLSVTTNTTLYLDQRVSCTPTEASSTARQCITGVNIPKIESGSIPESNQIVTQVGGTSNTWQYEQSPYDSNYWRFFDISYQCDLNCDTDIDFCQYGCNTETGYCFQQPVGGGISTGYCNQSIFLPICSVANVVVNTTTNVTLSQSLQGSGFGFVLLFLTPILYIMLVVVAIMILASWATKHMEIGLASGVGMMIVMAVIFAELVWITIVFVVIAGFIVGRTIVKGVQGG